MAKTEASTRRIQHPSVLVKTRLSSLLWYDHRCLVIPPPPGGGKQDGSQKCCLGVVRRHKEEEKKMKESRPHRLKCVLYHNTTHKIKGPKKMLVYTKSILSHSFSKLLKLHYISA